MYLFLHGMVCVHRPEWHGMCTSSGMAWYVYIVCVHRMCTLSYTLQYYQTRKFHLQLTYAISADDTNP